MYRLQGYKIMHIHWLYGLGITRRLPFYRKLSFIYALLFLGLTRLFGYKIVWTVHNTLPHSQITSDDLGLAKKLSRVANTKIAHSRFTIAQMKEYGFDTNNISLIPHGNYSGVYPSNTTRLEARKQLAIKDNEIVILFFGLIRTYKGVDDLLDAFERLDAKNTRLIIAGKCVDKNLRKQIRLAAASYSVDFYEGHIANEDVAKFFRAADVVCLPFKSITTSGSILLALTFGKPIIAPRAGALADLPESVGYLYEPKQPEALYNSLQKAIENKVYLNKVGKKALVYAKALSWDKIAEQTFKVYKELLSH